VTLALALAALLKRRDWALPVFIALFLLAHLATPHKEYRFLVPVLPLAFAAVGVAMAGLPAGLVSRLSALAAALGLWSTVHLASLTMGDLGAYLERPQARAWGDYAHVNRLLMIAGRQPDLCGLRIDVADLAWTGGSTYLHRKVPLYRGHVPPQLGYFNYGVDLAGREHHGGEYAVGFHRLAGLFGTDSLARAQAGVVGGEHLEFLAARRLDQPHAVEADVEAPRHGLDLPAVAEEQEVALYRLPLSTCRSDPSFDWQLR